MKTLAKLLIAFLFLTNMACTKSSKKVENKLNYLALGDSYTIGESVPENKRFPVQLVNKLNKNGIKTDSAKIIATTGWTTDELAAAINKETLHEKYDLITLLIGVNNQFRGRDTSEYRIQFVHLLETALAFGNKNPQNVIVISIPDYGVTPFAKERDPKKIGLEIDIFNQINKEETKKAGAVYVDITGISRNAKINPALIAKDGLHPSGEMYRLWVEEIFPAAKQILKDHN